MLFCWCRFVVVVVVGPDVGTIDDGVVAIVVKLLKINQGKFAGCVENSKAVEC